MISFVKCPCCAGHEAISPEAAQEIAQLIIGWVDELDEGPVRTELENISNAILNRQERAADIDPLLA